MSNRAEHAIVIGGSMTGLLTARVLLDHFQRVTLLERDHFPEGPQVRAGVPQGRHLHVLLSRGHQILEGLFPGVDAEMEAAGIPRIEWAWDTFSIARNGKVAPRFHSGVFTRASSRPLLEHLVRRRLLTTPGVNLIERAQVTGLTSTPDHRAITGVSYRLRGSTAGDQVLTADFVVDASGRSSPLPEWLVALGYGTPREQIVNSHLAYASRLVRHPVGLPEGRLVVSIASPGESLPRGGVVMHIEDDLWVVTISGANGDHPPTDDAGFEAFVQGLSAPHIAQFLQGSQPVSPVYGYQRTLNRWLHYEELSRWPERLAVLGDAACAFNPIYGQGMTTGALSAVELGAVLGRSRLEQAGARFQKRLAKRLQIPWLMATSEDFRLPTTEGERPASRSRLVQAYLNQAAAVMSDDAHISQAFIEIINMLKSPAALFSPAVMWRVWRAQRSKGSHPSKGDRRWSIVYSR
jgi:2-polyprenyl-6-methoxyphenol hydroxylase-like FAD-dependent oxidoreductase